MPAHQVTPQAASASQAQGSCQYPGRSTNPKGGCDNTDPCDPASAAKGGSGDCGSKPVVKPKKPVVKKVVPIKHLKSSCTE